MKVVKNHFVKILVIVSCLNMLYTIKVNTSNKDVKISREYSPEHTPGVIKELFLKIKKGDGKNSDIYTECLNLMTNAKNADNMKLLWDNIKASQIAPKPENVQRKFFSDFTKSLSEQVLVDDMKRDCGKTVIEEMMERSELESDKIQKQIKDLVQPYFPRSNPYQSGKNLVTAFIGVHRDTTEGRELIPKLNGGK